MRRRWESDCGRYTVEVRTSVLCKMERLAREHSPNEVGAALVGTYSAGGNLATVTDMAPIAPDSKGKRYSYLRGVEGVGAFFRGLLQASQGRRYYVGEWHSHPGGWPDPSGRDDRNGLAIAKDSDECCPECIMVILALRERVEVGVFVYSRGHGRVVLKPICLNA